MSGNEAGIALDSFLSLSKNLFSINKLHKVLCFRKKAVEVKLGNPFPVFRKVKSNPLCNLSNNMTFIGTLTAAWALRPCRGFWF